MNARKHSEYPVELESIGPPAASDSPPPACIWCLEGDEGDHSKCTALAEEIEYAASLEMLAKYGERP